MEIRVLSSVDGQTKDRLILDDSVFSVEYREPLIHQLILSYQANGRQATAWQKNRAAVSGGGRKPWKQKGGGRARAGSSRSPIWRSGGKTFVGKRSYEQKLNKKMYRIAMRGLFSELIRQERLVVVDALTPETHKTQDFKKTLGRLRLENVLILAEEMAGNLYLATRNLPGIHLTDVRHLQPVGLLSNNKVLTTVSALKNIEGQLQ